MTKVKIIYDRKNCSGCCTCVNLDPDNWEMAKDAKCNLKENTEREDELFVKEIEYDMRIQMASDQCPASVIKLERLKE